MAEMESRELRGDTRVRWVSRGEFVRRLLANQADSPLAGELRQLAPDMTDDLPAL